VAEQQVATTRARPGVARDEKYGKGFFTGIGFMLRGLGMYARSPRLMIMGLVPAVISFVVLVGAFVAMIYFIDDAVRLMTPYANGWAGGVRDTFRLVVGLVLAAVWVILSVVFYVAFTLFIGQPFYEAISKRVDDQLGGVPGEIDVSFWRMVPHMIADSIRLLVRTAIFGVVLFLIGLIPVAGEIAAPILAALFGGWVLALELTEVPFSRRRLRFKHRRQALSQHRLMAMGFGVTAFVLFLIPFGAVLAMPAAVAGATLLARRLFDQPDADA
jgi:CysZ protein